MLKVRFKSLRSTCYVLGLNVKFFFVELKFNIIGRLFNILSVI